MQVVRKKLTPDEITPPNIRYNPDCDCVEQTWDGGATWTATPGADPRSSPAYRAPARTGTDPQCNAAANMVAALRDMVDADVAADNSLSLATLLLGTALLFVPVAGWIADAFLLIADAIILLDQATIEAAFTSTVYDNLLCTFFCNLDPDGQMSDSQLVDFLGDVFVDYDFTVYSVITNHSNTLGAVGWSNMGALGTATGADCTGCGCAWCYEWPDAASIASGYFTQLFDPQGGQSVFYSVTFDVAATITEIKMNFTSGGASGAAALWCPISDRVALFTLGSPVTEDIYYNDPMAPEPPIVSATGVQFGANGNTSGDVTTLNSYRLKGTGTMPAFTGGNLC